MKYGELNLGQIEAIVNKLGGIDGVRRFLSGDLKVKEAKHHWKVWKSIKCDKEIDEMDLVKVTVAELGFKKGARRNQIYVKAEELGLELCPAGVGPQLRLQCKDQLNRERILIAMELITYSVGDGLVGRAKRCFLKLWLISHYDRPDDFWAFDSQWVFVLPRPQVCK